MDYPIYKQRWVKDLPDGKIAEVYSIHLSIDSAKEFIEQQKKLSCSIPIKQLIII